MKRKVSIVLSCIITACLTIMMVQYMGHFLDPAWTGVGMDHIRSFHSLDEDSLDVIVYGSSRAFKGCDSMEMYKKYGLGVYNYGNNWQSLNTILLFLQDSLRTQTPKIVCIETSLVDSVEEDTNMDGQIYYTREISHFDGKSDYLKQCFGDDPERYASYYFPLIMFHDNWNQINSENYSISNPMRFTKSMGYSGSNEIEPATIGDYKTFEQKELPKNSLEILDKMVKVCEDNGVQIIFYTCPYQGEYAYYEAMSNYAAEHGCAYLNLFESISEIDLNPETDFRDPDHLNDSGAVKVADFLGAYIVEHYEITDMRTVEGNIWEQNLQ